jgi:hypothetical protein
MKLIICLDDKNGISFADRRQSRDRAQIEKMLQTVGEEKLYVSDYSASLFGEIPENVIVCASPVDEAKDGYCFIERDDVSFCDFEEIIIYRWNRVYPSDEKFDVSLLDGKNLVSTTDFKGNSHERITEEVYR